MNPTVAGVSSGNRRWRLPAGRLCATAGLAFLVVVAVASLALAESAGFPDVPTTHPYYAAITDLASRGVIGGYADGRFGPADPVTRQQFAKMAVLAAGYPVSESDVCDFVDVGKSDAGSFYPDNYIAVCARHGITTGKTATSFDPQGKITRYQMVSMVVRAANDLRPGLLTDPPAGWAATGSWGKDATHGANAARAEYNRLLSGLDLGALDPYGNAARGEVAQILSNLLERLTTYVVYDDAGTVGADIQTWSGADWGGAQPQMLDSRYATPGVPEGTTCFAAKSGAGQGNYVGWGVCLGIFENHDLVTAATTDLSGYTELVFMVKSGVDLKVEVQAQGPDGPKSAACRTSAFGWTPGSPGTWQKVTIPRTAFGSLDWARVFSPFMVTGEGGGVTFYVDDVKWVR